MLKGKIVLVPFPFDDLSAAKARPAVCLTEEIGPHGHVVLAFITSQVPDAPSKTDLVLHSSADGFDETGLKYSSTIRFHRLATITSGLIVRELGRLPERLLPEIDSKLQSLFSLSEP